MTGVSRGVVGYSKEKSRKCKKMEGNANGNHPLLSISLQITFLQDPVRSLCAFLIAEVTLS